MAKYNYSTNVIPVFIERREEEIDAFATQWTVEAGNANGKNLIFDVTAYNPQADFYNAEFVAEIQLNSTGDTVLAAQDTVLINNFFPKLFSRITVEWNGEIMEEINDPFVTSTVLKFITKSKDYLSGDGQIEGFIPDAEFNNTHENTNTGRELRKILYNGAPNKKFMITYKLSDLFGICADWKHPIYKIPFKVTLTRQSDEDTNKFLFHTDDDNDDKVGNVIIKKINLKVPLNELNSEPQKTFESQFNSNKEVDILYNGINTYSGTVSGNGAKTILVTTATQPPELIVLVFQSTTYEYNDNSGLFKTGDISQIELRIGNTQKYPVNPMKINIAERYYEEMYKQYSYTCKIYGNEPLLSYVEFKNNYPMYVFPTQKQDRDVFSVGATINLYINKTTPTEYKWTVIYLENKWFRSKLLSNGMSRPQQITFNSK